MPSAFAQSEQASTTAKSQSVDQHEKELRTRFDLHEEREIAGASEVAKEYLKKYPNSGYAVYLKMWLKAFEIARKDYPTHLYKRAEFMRKWREENWQARDDLLTHEVQSMQFGKRGVILLTDVLGDVEARAKRKQALSP
jgi:hypothetical protein